MSQVRDAGSSEPPASDAEAAHARSAQGGLTAAVTALDPGGYAAAQAAVVEQSMREGLTWERPTGGYDPVPLMLRPRVWTQEQAAYVQRACLAVQRGLGRLLPAWLERDDVRALLPLAPYEEERIRSLAAKTRSLDDAWLFARLDAIVDACDPRWERTLAFLEPNVVGVGGTRYTALAEKVWMESARPHLGMPDVLPALDSRRLLLDHLLDRARAVGIDGPVRLALVEDLREIFGTNELRQIAAYFTEQGTPAIHVDVRSLELRGGQLHADGHPVDFVYRFPEIRELEELDRGGALDALWRCFLEDRVVSTLGGDFDHKSTFELMTSARFDALFCDEDRRTFHRHVLWTRLLGHRRTDTPDGSEVDLPAYVRAHRASLVLKPNRSYGGTGVVVGPETTDAAWEKQVDEALEAPGAWVVQAYRPLPRESFPVWADGGWRSEERLVVSGFYATPRGVTSMGRVSAQAVVNLSRPGSALVPQVTVA